MAITAIGSDYTASSGVSTSSSSGANFFDYLALGTSATAPALTESLAYAGYDSAAAISSATANATYGSAVMASGSGNYLTTGSLGSSYSTSYYTGGGLYSSTDVSSSVEDILTETATSQAYLIGIQAQLGQQQSTFTAVSNALNTKHSMERSAIQNFRA